MVESASGGRTSTSACDCLCNATVAFVFNNSRSGVNIVVVVMVTDGREDPNDVVRPSSGTDDRCVVVNWLKKLANDERD